MEFCEECGTRLILKHNEGEEEAILICNKCGYKKLVESLLKPKVTEPKSEDQIIVIGKKEQKLQTLPTATIDCPKCGNNKANTWQVQTRGADESSTQFFRCTKCYYTFREYS